MVNGVGQRADAAAANTDASPARAGAMAITRQRTMQDFAHQMRWMVDGLILEYCTPGYALDTIMLFNSARVYQSPPSGGSRPPAWAALVFFIDAAKMGNLSLE